MLICARTNATTADCHYLNEHPKLKGINNAAYLLLTGVFDGHNCPRNKYHIDSNAKQTTISGVTILHTPDENIELIQAVADNNIQIFKENIAPNRQGNFNMNTSGASLDAYMVTIQRLCTLHIKLDASKNKKFWFVSNTPAEPRQFCLNAAVILAANYVSIIYNGGTLYEKTSY